MHARRFPALFIAAVVSVLVSLACEATATPTATSLAVTPYIPATTPSAPAAVDTPPGPAPTEPPTSPPPSDWLPDGTIALYLSGSWESRRLYTLAGNGSSGDLGLTGYQWTAVSRSGRWVARPSGPSPASEVLITNLETAATNAIPSTAGFDIYGMAFDPAETRLAFLELGAPEAGGTNWAIVVVRLDDNTTTRFEATAGADHAFMPGIPIGWSASGGELLINTFPPYSEGASLGVWAMMIPPGTPSAPLNTLARREILPSGSYQARPHFSTDHTRLLYLARNPGYTPTGYEPVAYDTAVNQLWSVELASGARTLLLEASDGSALASDADWSPSADRTLFAQGSYAGETFASLTLRIRDGAGGVSDVGSLPLPADGYPNQLAWCRPDLAIYTTMAMDGSVDLYLVNLIDGSALLVNSADAISVLGCVP